MAYLAQEKYDDAKREFTALGGKTGRGYLEYIKSEIERKKILEREIEIEEIEKNEILEAWNGNEQASNSE